MNAPRISKIKNKIWSRVQFSLSILTQKISVIDASSLFYRSHRPAHAFRDSGVTTVLTITEECLDALNTDPTATLSFKINGEIYELIKANY